MVHVERAQVNTVAALRVGIDKEYRIFFLYFVGFFIFLIFGIKCSFPYQHGDIIYYHLLAQYVHN
jgi:hypothetical protein